MVIEATLFSFKIKSVKINQNSKLEAKGQIF